MTLARTAIQDFSTANPAYENAQVTAYKVVDGAKSDLWVKPIYIKQSDISCMARSTKQQILLHNETWEKMQ